MNFTSFQGIYIIFEITKFIYIILEFFKFFQIPISFRPQIYFGFGNKLVENIVLININNEIYYYKNYD